MKNVFRQRARRFALSYLAFAAFGAGAFAELPAAFKGIDFKAAIPEEKNIVFEADFNGGAGGYEKADLAIPVFRPLGVSFGDGAAVISVDYAKDADKDYSKAGGFSLWLDKPKEHESIGKARMDVYFDEKELEDGGGTLGIEFFIKCEGKEDKSFETILEPKKATAVSGSIKMQSIEIEADAYESATTNQIAVLLVGHKTAFKGSVLIDNFRVNSEERVDNSSVSTTRPSKEKPAVRIRDGMLVTAQGSIPLPVSVSLSDENADDSAKAVYAYLSAMGKSGSAIYGHQNDTWRKAGSPSLSASDTKDATGSISGIVGIDALSLTGNEYSAEEFNRTLGKKFGTKLPETLSGNVAAAAILTNETAKEGALITMSAHIPNFKRVKEKGLRQASKNAPYERYDFSGYTPGVFDGDIMNNILPGGAYSGIYTAYLDMIADYAHQVQGAILFRPFHENTGSWFWWGKAFCDAETYKNMYRFTVDYLKNEKDVHNFIYVYSPGAEASSVEEYAERYPGDEYVDMVGFDMYHDDPAQNDSFFSAFAAEISIVQEFARRHKKLFAVTETGIRTTTPERGHNQTALRSSGNKVAGWYGKMLETVSASDASYFLLWANFSKRDGYYSPYVNEILPDGFRKGHEMLDPFISFFNDKRSVFAVQQQEAISSLDGSKITQIPFDTAKGYITSPVGGTRILKPAVLSANAFPASENDGVSFIISADEEVVLPAMKKGNSYSAKLDKKTLSRLGMREGTISLAVGGTEVQKIKVIFNVAEPKEDPLLVDDFEKYLGTDDLLQKSWNTNKASGSDIRISLDKENKHSGNFGMKFSYSETTDGWAGAVIAKGANWSKQNAVQFWTKPDGNNQKTVFQIVANKRIYEVYLQEYDGYKGKTGPVLVTIPFSEFCERDAPGQPKGKLVQDAGKIEQVGLWVNAIAGSDAAKDGTVSGTIYYDDIKAVKTSSTVPRFE